MSTTRLIAWTVKKCVCVSDHRPQPLFCDEHHLDPLYAGGPDTDDNKIVICSATHGWVHRIFRDFERANEILPRKVGQPLYAYAVAKDGFTRMKRRQASH